MGPTFAASQLYFCLSCTSYSYNTYFSNCKAVQCLLSNILLCKSNCIINSGSDFSTTQLMAIALSLVFIIHCIICRLCCDCVEANLWTYWVVFLPIYYLLFFLPFFLFEDSSPLNNLFSLLVLISQWITLTSEKWSTIKFHKCQLDLDSEVIRVIVLSPLGLWHNWSVKVVKFSIENV